MVDREWLDALRAAKVDIADPMEKHPLAQCAYFSSKFIEWQQEEWQGSLGLEPERQVQLPSAAELFVLASGYGTPQQRFRTLRVMAGLTGSEIADGDCAASTAASEVSKYENGKGVDGAAICQRLCSKLGVNIRVVTDGYCDLRAFGDPHQGLPFIEPWHHATHEAQCFVAAVVQAYLSQHALPAGPWDTARIVALWQELGSPPALINRQAWWDAEGSYLTWFADAGAEAVNHLFDRVDRQMDVIAERSFQALVHHYLGRTGAMQGELLYVKRDDAFKAIGRMPTFPEAMRLAVQAGTEPRPTDSAEFGHNGLPFDFSEPPAHFAALWQSLVNGESTLKVRPAAPDGPPTSEPAEAAPDPAHKRGSFVRGSRRPRKKSL